MKNIIRTIIRRYRKSWGLWVSTGALICFLVKTFVDIDISKQINDFLNVLLPIVIGLGLVNNPENQDTI
jgi:uncharacterized membrane protein